MPNANVSFELGEVTFGERLRDQPHVATNFYPAAIGDSNARRFLTTVLEGKKSEENDASYVHGVGVDAEDAAILAH